MNVSILSNVQRIPFASTSARRNAGRFFLLGLAALAFLTAMVSPARADSRCRDGVSVTYQYSDTVLDHAAAKATQNILGTLRSYIPSAPALDLNRQEHTFELNYDHQIRDFGIMRVYGGVSIAPDALVYRASGDALYHDQNITDPIPIGQVDASLNTSVDLYTAGVDFLGETGKCGDALRLVGGMGAAVMAFQGGLTGQLDALLTGPGPDYTLSGSFFGFAVDLSFLLGFRFDILGSVSLMILAGYRLGVGYISVHSDIISTDSAMPIFGPFVQITAGATF